MYDKQKLSVYPFFKAIEKQNYIDSLTHTIDEEHINAYAKELVEDNKPFAIAKINVDNFKLVNENYGHHFGDIILSKLGEILINAVGEDGIVGRFGNDEFVILYFGDYSYDTIWANLKKLFDNELRKKIDLGNIDLHITCTAGAAVYPIDAKSYDDLNTCVQKALIRGKNKGRNCFIVYVEDKHKNIDLMKNSEALLDDMAEIHRIISKNGDKTKRIVESINYLTNTLSLAAGMFIVDNKAVITNTDCVLDGFNVDLFKDKIKLNGSLSCNNYSDYISSNPEIHSYLWENRIYSFVIQEVKYGSKLLGYLVFVDKVLKRVWQIKDKAIISFIASSMSHLLNE